MKFEIRCKMLTAKEIKLEINDLLKGCGKNVENGACYFYRNNGNKPVYCSSCTRKLRILENTLKEKEQ